MKNLFLLILLMVVTPVVSMGQTMTFPTTAGAQGGFTLSTTAMTGGAIGLLNSDTHFHTLTWYVNSAAPSGCTVILESSTSGLVGGTWTSLIGAQTCTSTGETITATAGDVNFVRIRATAFTGAATSVVVLYKGWIQNPYGSLGLSSPTTGLTVNTVGTSGATTFSVGVMGSAISVGVTTVAPFGTTTTLVQGLLVTNSCATAVTVTIADGNNNPILGSETASNGTFSIPSLGQLPIYMGIVGHVLTGGLKASAVGSNNCIFMWAEGKQ